MDLKKYEKTRYQNIYRNIKNKNYIIMLSKPVKTSIASVEGKKIMKLEEALKIRDNPKIKHVKATETLNKEDFDSMWCKYITWCKYDAKLEYNTIVEKNKVYIKYFENKIVGKLTKLNKQYFIDFIERQNCSLKQKNHILKELKAFFNWCIKEEYMYYSPVSNISKYKVEKTKMKFWTPNELKIFLEEINNCIKNNIYKETAYRTKILTLIGFTLGDRIGETRALTFDMFNKETKSVSIMHSINYNKSSQDFVSHTKTYQSQRVLDISDKLIEEINNYKYFLVHELGYEVKDNELIFLNRKTNKPVSDTSLRKSFYYFCDRANVERIRMYDLRHTYVAIMMEEGKELYHISERLGHSNYQTTVNHYGHLSNKIRKEIAKTTDKYY